MCYNKLVAVAFAIIWSVIFPGEAGAHKKSALEAPQEVEQGRVNQGEIARLLLQENNNERHRAFREAERIGVNGITEELRTALFALLEKLTTRVRESWERGGFTTDVDNPEFIGHVAHFVAEFHDPRSIPGLASLLHGSRPALATLANFGETAVQPLLETVMSTEDGGVLMDGLTVLRWIVEGAETRPLSSSTTNSIRRVAEQRLTGQQFPTTLWNAIDLAIALNDPDLRRTVESLAADVGAVFARGITDPDDVFRTQRRAADALAGVPPLPRRPTTYP